MEEDDPSDAAVDALIGREEQLAVAAPVLLCVLHPDGVQALRHTTCKTINAQGYLLMARNKTESDLFSGRLIK